MIQTKQKSVALATLAAVVTTSCASVFVQPAEANSNSWKNWAIGGAAITGYGLVQHNRGLALAGAVGTIYAYSRYRHARKREKQAEWRREHWHRYHHRYHG